MNSDSGYFPRRLGRFPDALGDFLVTAKARDPAFDFPNTRAMASPISAGLCTV